VLISSHLGPTCFCSRLVLTIPSLTRALPDDNIDYYQGANKQNIPDGTNRADTPANAITALVRGIRMRSLNFQSNTRRTGRVVSFGGTKLTRASSIWLWHRQIDWCDCTRHWIIKACSIFCFSLNKRLNLSRGLKIALICLQFCYFSYFECKN
jgi:hypothetical protein